MNFNLTGFKWMLMMMTIYDWYYFKCNQRTMLIFIYLYFLFFLEKMHVDLLTSLLNLVAVKQVCKCVILFVKSWTTYFIFLWSKSSLLPYFLSI